MRVGIDLGPTDCCIARVDADVRPTLIPDQNDPDALHTPSAVHVFGSGAFVGRTAEQLLECDPDLPVVRGISQRLGETAPVHDDDSGSKWYVEGIAALLLKKLRVDAEAQASSNIEGAVLAVPTCLNEAQRQSLLAASALADLPVFGLVEEPVAVALHYGIDTGAAREAVLVWDLGGKTVDVTLLRCDSSGLNIARTGGLRDKGGCRIDEHIGDLVLAQFGCALGSPVTMGGRALLELRRVSREIKLEFMNPTCSSVRKPVMLGGMVVEIQVRRSELAPVIGALVNEIAAASERCLKDAGAASKDVAKVLLAGGTALMPAVAERVRELFPKAQVLCREPDRAVACGAAIRAARLGTTATPVFLSSELKGVTGSAVGIRTIDATTARVHVDTLIKKDMQLPARAQKPYYTTRRQQERVVIDCVRVSEAGEAVASIGQVVVGPLQTERANYIIEVTATCREDGAVKIEAYDPQTGVESAQVFGGTADGVTSRLATQRALVRSTVVNGVLA
jgi:molecular chaperone DnaK